MPTFLAHLRTNIIRGLVTAVPVMLSVGALALVYHLVHKYITVPLDDLIGDRIPFLDASLVVLCLYLLGLIATNVLGRQFFGLMHTISARIPLVGEIYGTSKEVSDALVHSDDGSVFKKTVFVQYPNAQTWTIAFLAGRIKDKNTGEDWFKVYFPMAHPVIGFVYFAKEEQIWDPHWTVEEGFKAMISWGLIVPKGA